ncbi:MAG: NAD(P)/FAD-dependent oxidoreductase [Nitrospirae bacterium]|nr:NAD(P)/FAD-dependent oxidoreductase [Nitrospirota bacterium]
MALTEYDLAVIGAGPSGSSAALAAVRAGLRTVIIERRPLPRHKPCSGLVIPEAIEVVEREFGRPPRSVFAEPGVFHGMRMHFGSGRHLDIPVGGWMVWRDRFDKWLCDVSRAEIRDGTSMTTFAEDRDGVTVQCRPREGDPYALRCRVLVAADGGRSDVAGKLDPRGQNRLPWFVAVQDTYEARVDLEPGYFHYFTHPEFSRYPAAYLKDGLMVMDVGGKLGEKLTPHQEKFKQFLRRECGYEEQRLVRRLGCPITFAVPEGWFHAGTDRVLVVGEASGLLNMFGEGISSALASGLIAGRAAAEALARGAAPGPPYRERVEVERRRTAGQFRPLNQIFGSVGGMDWKIGVRRLAMRDRLPVLADLGAWFWRERKQGREARSGDLKTGHPPSTPIAGA